MFMKNKKIKVLPIYPRSPLSFWGFQKALELAGKKSTMPPTGLATAMAMFPRDRFEVMPIQDLNITSLNESLVKESDLIATSSMIIHEKSLNEVIDTAHKLGKNVLAGGPFPSVSSKRVNADYIVAGESEITLKPFLEDYLKGNPKKVYIEEEVKYRSNVELTKSGKPDLKQTPLPRWDLIPDLNAYDSIGIQYSRGCPYACEFCNITSLFGREPRTKGTQQMLEEFQALYNLGYMGGIFLLDDNLIGNIKNLKEFLPEFIKWQKQRDYPYELGTEASMNLAWPENTQILENMVEAGFTRVFLGIESVDPDMIEGMNKKQNLRMPPYEAVRKIQNKGLEVTGGLIVGNDGEKPEVFDNLYNFLQTSGIVVPMAGLLSVIPGTKLALRLEQEGRLRKETKGSNTHSFSLDFDPKLSLGFSEEQLMQGYKKFLAKIFDSKNYYERCRVLQSELGKNHSHKYPLCEGLRILGRFTKDQLTGGADFQTLKYLGETLVRNSKNFPMAVSHAIKYQHLKEITEEALSVEEYPLKVGGMYDAFTTKVEEIYKRHLGDVYDARDEIAKKEKKLLQRAEKAYHKLHEDFRPNVRYALDSLKNKLKKKEYKKIILSH